MSNLGTNGNYECFKYGKYSKIGKKKLELKNKQIKNLFMGIMSEDYEIKSDVEVLGGMNNNNFKIYTNKGDFVFRLPGKASNESVDRDSEHFNSKIAFDIGIDCKTIYFDKKSGIKISKYIESAETLNIKTSKRENNMESISFALKTLHNSKKKFYRNFKPFIEIKEYKNIIIKRKKELLENYSDLNSIIAYLKNKLEKIELDYVPCHLDAWPENFVKDREKIYLIDWEYSSNYDKLWDVASVVLECEYSVNEQELFYRKYFGRNPCEEEFYKMKVLSILIDIYWSLWSMAKVSCGEKEIYQYSINRYNRAVNNFQEIKKSI